MKILKNLRYSSSEKYLNPLESSKKGTTTVFATTHNGCTGVSNDNNVGVRKKLGSTRNYITRKTDTHAVKLLSIRFYSRPRKIRAYHIYGWTSCNGLSITFSSDDLKNYSNQVVFLDRGLRYTRLVFTTSLATIFEAGQNNKRCKSTSLVPHLRLDSK